MSEIFDELYNYSGADDVACQHRSGINYAGNTEGVIEVTLNPTKSRAFDNTYEGYLKLFDKIVNYIKNCLHLFIEITDFSHIFEHGKKSNKLHLHGRICVKTKHEIAPMGIIYDIVNFTLKLLRRKMLVTGIFTDFHRIKTQAVTMQYVTNAQRIQEWQDYMHKAQDWRSTLNLV